MEVDSASPRLLPLPSPPSLSDLAQPHRSPAANAATCLQKAYRSYTTRRRLADCAVVAEELWWQVLEYAQLSHSTVSFYRTTTPETPISRWNRVKLNASKVGHGLSRDEKAIKLAFQHWIEAIDPRHRYGHNLHFYYDKWCTSSAGQPFFYWLDLGEGRDIDLEECPRSLLKKQVIKYLGPHEREQYEFVAVEGRIVRKLSREFLNTTGGGKNAKWIFVMSADRKLYAGEKKKGSFHHSSFLAGGATMAAGRFTAEDGILKSISAYSGHYRPSDENLGQFLTFLRENGISVENIQIKSSSNEDYYDDPKMAEEKMDQVIAAVEPPLLVMPNMKQNSEAPLPVDDGELEDGTVKSTYQRTLSGGLRSPRAEVPEEAILRRINSKRNANSYQLGHQLSRKWSTGAGPRIGCIADYPPELRKQALEFVSLSPRPLTPGPDTSFTFTQG